MEIILKEISKNFFIYKYYKKKQTAIGGKINKDKSSI